MGEIIALATPEITEDLHKLLSGQTITTYIDTSVTYPEIQENPYSIYSFLLVAGYLRVSAIYPQHDGNFMCDVGIPNKEIAYVYEKEVLNKTNQNSIANFKLLSLMTIIREREPDYTGREARTRWKVLEGYKNRSNREGPLLNGIYGISLAYWLKQFCPTKQ